MEEDWKLSDPVVQEAIGQFIRNARICAETPDGEGGVLGFAAMTTIFGCVLAVGEALLGLKENGKYHATGEVLKEFYKHMEDMSSWIFPPEGAALTDEKTLEILEDIRHGFAHSLTMPSIVMLLANLEEEKRLHEETYELIDRIDAIAGLSKWRIVVPKFIDAVEAAVEKASRDHPDKIWDPAKGKRKRGPVATTGSGNSLGDVITSGSTSMPPLKFRNTLGTD